jgi:hypothetical protein
MNISDKNKMQIINRQKHSVIYIVIFCIILLFIWSWFAFNTGNADYNIYKNWYITTCSNGLQYRFEIGFSMSMLIGAKLGLLYNQWLMIYSAIGIIMVGKSFYDYCNYPCIAVVMYFFYPYFFDVVQIRNFMAMAITFFALRFLKKFNIKNVITYIGFVLLAMLFHVTAFFAFAYMLVYVEKSVNVVKIVSFVIATFCIIYFISPTTINKLLLFFGNEVYLEQGSSLIKLLGYGLWAVIALVLSVIYDCQQNNGKETNESYYFLIKIMPILCLTVLLIGLSWQTYRFFRNIMPILYVVFINNGIKVLGRKIRFKQIELINIIFACCVCGFFYFHQLSKGAELYHTVTEKILTCNSLWQR